MGIFRRIATVLGFLRDEAHGGGGNEEDEDPAGEDASHRLPRRGFTVQVPVTVERPNVGPVLVPCNLGEGGVQGFRWYGRRLRMDEDGDVADEFLDEVMPEASSSSLGRTAAPSFEVKYNTRPAPVRKQAIAVNGNIHQRMDYQGSLVWV